MNDTLILNERFNDNGSHSHWEVINSEGEILFTQDVENVFMDKHHTKDCYLKPKLEPGGAKGETIEAKIRGALSPFWNLLAMLTDDDMKDERELISDEMGNCVIQQERILGLLRESESYALSVKGTGMSDEKLVWTCKKDKGGIDYRAFACAEWCGEEACRLKPIETPEPRELPTDDQIDKKYYHITNPKNSKELAFNELQTAKRETAKWWRDNHMQQGGCKVCERRNNTGVGDLDNPHPPSNWG